MFVCGVDMKNPIKIIDEKMTKFEQIGQLGLLEFVQDFQDTKNKFHCPNCGKRFMLIIMILKAKVVKNGEKYYMTCRKCHQVTPITKGE